jgi:hypothetical protein
MYKLWQTQYTDGSVKVETVIRLADNAFIPFNTGNVDYQEFKQQINDETAQLEDVDGNVMSPEAAKAYVTTLP